MPAEDGPYDADIVVLALDRAEETLAAIASALGQLGGRFRLIVLDQGSAPDTLIRFEQALAGHPNATLLRSGRNLGVAGGRNAASAAGNGRIIVGLDNDAVFATPYTVAQAVAAFAGSAGSVEAVIGFRGGWGLGNAFFISTALATIVGAA